MVCVDFRTVDGLIRGYAELFNWVSTMPKPTPISEHLTESHDAATTVNFSKDIHHRKRHQEEITEQQRRQKNSVESLKFPALDVTPRRRPSRSPASTSTINFGQDGCYYYTGSYSMGSHLSGSNSTLSSGVFSKGSDITCLPKLQRCKSPSQYSRARTDLNSDHSTRKLSYKTFEETKRKANHKVSGLSAVNGANPGNNTPAGDGDPFDNSHLNPGSMSYQPKKFMTSSLMKRLQIRRRLYDSYGGCCEYSTLSKQGIALSRNRFQWGDSRELDSLDQKERMRIELDYVEKLRSIKKRREVWPHRVPLDLLLAGERVILDERFDLNTELRRIKAIVLPDEARDLFHGKGIKLPSGHASLRPRHKFLLADDERIVSTSAPASLNPVLPSSFAHDNDFSKTSIFMTGYNHSLPKIDPRNTLGDITRATVTLKDVRKDTKDQYDNGPPPTPRSCWDRSICELPDYQFPENYTGIVIPRMGKKSLTTLPRVHSLDPVSLPLTDTKQEIKPHISKAPAITQDTIKELAPQSIVATPAVVSDTETVVESDTEKQTIIEKTKPSANPVKPELPKRSRTPNLLKGSTKEANNKDELQSAFKRLDTDKDGHLQYAEVKSQLPKEFTKNHEKFIKQVYDISSSHTFFGIEEFVNLSSLTKAIQELGPAPLEAYDKVDYAKLGESISEFVESFHTADTSGSGKITIAKFKGLVGKAMDVNMEQNAKLWDEISSCVETDTSGMMTQIHYISLMPYLSIMRDRVQLQKSTH